MFKKLSMILLLATILIVDTPIVKADEQTDTTDAITITPRKSIAEWRFKTIDGKLYKRLYDYNTNTWIGDWIRV